MTANLAGEPARPEHGIVPDACTLPLAEQPLRLEEFDSLLFPAVTHMERLEPSRLRLILNADRVLEQQLRDLAARENECCSFFAFTIDSPSEGRVVFDLGVPSGYISLLDSIAERASRMMAK